MNALHQEQYNIEIKDNILFVQANNLFNADVVKQYHQDMVKLTIEMKHQLWASLVVYQGSGVFSPEAEKHIIDITKFRMKNNMIANATVILDSAQADIQQMQLRRIYSSCRLPFFVFSNVASAQDWLQSFLAEQSQVC
ncbi:hypothetical protein [Colwellia sp. MEBiC06753]